MVNRRVVIGVRHIAAKIIANHFVPNFLSDKIFPVIENDVNDISVCSNGQEG